MSEILNNTGVKLWSETDYSELWLTVFDQLTGQGGKSNIRLIDEAIGKINAALDGYKFEFSSDEDRLYISKGDSKLPVSLIDSNGHVASKVDGTTITIDESGVVKGIPVDDALSEESTNPLQNKVIAGELKSIKSKMGTNESVIKQNTSDITSNTKRIEANETAISTLNGTGDGSVKKAVSDGIAEVVAGAPGDFDTLKEMSDWISGHENDASAMNSQIQDNKNKVSEKLDKTGDASNVTTGFTTATTRSNLTTKEKLSISLGKIAKWFSDLKTVAFSGSYNDLSNKPTSLPASDVSAWAKESTKPKYTKAEVGLGNVGNFKAVSTVASQGLTNTEKSNARANIGAQAAGSYASSTHNHDSTYRKKLLGTMDGDGKTSYCQLCTLKISQNYINTPIEITLQERCRSTLDRLSILFGSINNTNPSLDRFTVFGESCDWYISKTAASTWVIYGLKGESWAGIKVVDYTGIPGIDITWNMTGVSSLPDSKTQALWGGNVHYAETAGNVVNNQTTTKAGFALDARQANPNLDGTLAKQVADLNGSLNNVATKNDISALNPTSEIKLYTKLHIGSLGAGWYRIAEAVFMTDTVSKGAASTFIEIMLRQTWNVQVGCFHKVKIILVHSDKAKISSLGIGTLNLTKVRVVRKSSILYFDVFSRGYDNETQTLLNIPFPVYITSAKAYSDAKIVPETADGEVVVCSVDLADSI